jgi:flagellar hook-associated protein 1 FlgK
MDFVSGFNAQHQLGQTLDGNPGGDFFGFNGTPTALTAAGMVSVTLTNTRDVAAASPVATATGAANTGTAAIDSSRVINRTSLPFAGNVTLTFDGATNSFSASGGITAGPFAYAAGQPFTVGGVELTLTGTPANGDTFTLGNNPTGRNDNRNALLLGGVQTANLALGGTANFQSAYASLVADVGSNAREVQITSRAATTLVEQTTATQQGISGVNLDEEAANLLRYQQHYQASSKVIQIAGKIFDEILALGR